MAGTPAQFPFLRTKRCARCAGIMRTERAWNTSSISVSSHKEVRTLCCHNEDRARLERASGTEYVHVLAHTRLGDDARAISRRYHCSVEAENPFRCVVICAHVPKKYHCQRFVGAQVMTMTMIIRSVKSLYSER